MVEYNKKTNGSQKISLDVGGIVFNTTSETLLRQEESFFWGMLRSGQWQPDKTETGQYFIDRSPHVFGIILDYLRHGEVRVDPSKLPDGEKRLLQTELDFYQITIPEFIQQKPLVWDIDKCAGDPATYFCHDENTAVTLLDTSPETARLLFIPPFGSERREFVLEMLGRMGGLGDRACLWFNDFGVGLLAGQCNGSGSWKQEFPDLRGRSATVTQWQLSFDPCTSELRIKWPTGDTKAWHVKTEATEALYLGCSNGAGVTFRLKN